MTTSAERLQELESQLSGLLKLKPKSQKERQKLEQETETLRSTVASLKAYLALKVGGQVTDGQRFGVIISKTLSLDGMSQAWVSWSGAVEVPEQPERLTVIQPPPYAVVAQPQLPQDAPTIASLFTGGGLFEVGAMAAGFRPIWGIEHDPDHPDFSRQIADAYEHNFGAHIIRKTVQEVAQGGFQHLERPTALHISQPGQSFSAANSLSESETDLSAARAVQQAIQELQPSIVTVENVTSYRDSQSWQLIRETLTNLGYNIKEATVNAADYGVPQKRQRFLAWAVLQEPPPELLGESTQGMGWLEAIADLIPSLPESQLADWQLERIQNLLSKIQNGKAYLIERTGAPKERDLLVRPGNDPSWTIKANIATDQKGANRYAPLNALLPDGKVVSLDARAIARLQSVPDWYQLPDQIGVAVTLLGNGVPCLLASALMRTLHPVIGRDEIQIDSEFKALIPPLSSEERGQLESNLVREGCRDPLVVWKGHNILLDGHNRYDLCTQHGIEFKTVALELPDRMAAHDWIISNQLGRRNLTPEAVSYLRGKRYKSLKASVTNPEGKNQYEVGGHFDHQPKTEDRLAAEYKVGSRTIRRDAQYAKAVDTLADVVGEEVRTDLLSRGVKLTKRETLKLAKEASVNPEAVRQKLKQLGETKEIQSTTAPFPYKVGEVCLVIASDEPQLRGRGGCWAIVSKVHEHSCDLQLWNGTAELIKPEHLKSMEYTSEQQQQMQSLCHRLIRLRACGNLEPAAHSILSDLGRKKQPDLTPIEEKLLSVLESEYGLKPKPESANEQGIRPDSSHSEEVRASFSSPASSQKVEVNTNDILIAFASNLDDLSPAQLKFVGKAIARQSPERVEKVVEAIGISSEKQAIEIVKAIVLVYPEAIRDLIEEINKDKNSLVNDENPENGDVG